MITKVRDIQSSKKSVFQQAFLLKLVWVDVSHRDGSNREFRLVLNQLGSEEKHCFNSFEDLTTHLQTQEPSLIHG